jgi:hypothetical protein
MAASGSKFLCLEPIAAKKQNNFYLSGCSLAQL